MLNSCQEKSGRKYSDGCPRSSIEAIMMISQKTCYLGPASGCSRARILLNGDSRACPLYSGSMGFVSGIPTAESTCD